MEKVYVVEWDWCWCGYSEDVVCTNQNFIAGIFDSEDKAIAYIQKQIKATGCNDVPDCEQIRSNKWCSYVDPDSETDMEVTRYMYRSYDVQ